jgi:hypothetical protein
MAIFRILHCSTNLRPPENPDTILDALSDAQFSIRFYWAIKADLKLFGIMGGQ